VSLSVYDVAGREVARLLTHEHLAAGAHQVEFHGAGLPSGVYLCRLQAGGRAQTARRGSAMRFWADAAGA